MLFDSFILLLSLILPISALPEPAGFIQQRPHQVGFPIPQPQSPPYGKSLPASSLQPSRHWDWTHWLTDAKQAFKALLGKHKPHRPVVNYEDERNMGKFDNDIVLRVNVTALTDRMAIIELAEVITCFSYLFVYVVDCRV